MDAKVPANRAKPLTSACSRKSANMLYVCTPSSSVNSPRIALLVKLSTARITCSAESGGSMLSSAAKTSCDRGS